MVDGFKRRELRAEWLVGRLALLTVEYKNNSATPEQLLGYTAGMPRYPIKKWLA